MFCILQDLIYAMSIPFEKIIDAQRSFSFYLWIALMLVSIIFALIWAQWFFLSSVNIYKTSQNIFQNDKETIRKYFSKHTHNQRLHIELYRTKKIVADFPIKDLKQIKTGQPALIYLKDAEGISRQLPATVTQVINPGNKKEGHVVLEAQTKFSAHTPSIFKDAKVEKVKINTSHLSPATILFRASGLGIDTPKVTAGPRNVYE